jgi:biofilm PGA synthesis N-glycosyltransferase PgaC
MKMSSTIKSPALTYVVVTPAHNEGTTLRGVIDSMAAQVVPPLKWIVVDDASTDNTAALVLEAKRSLPWIELLALKREGGRNFGGKANGFNAGVSAVEGLTCDCVANLDADVTIAPDHFAYLLNCLEADPRLGVVGTPFQEPDFKGYDYRFSNPAHVSGQCQLFRKACLREIGGYTPIEFGGVDWVASTTARMLGWGTKTCPDRVLMHHRRMGTGNPQWGNLRLRQGKKDYMLGNSLSWEFMRCLYQARYRPYVVGGLLMLVGYLQCAVVGKPKPISDRLVKFVRDEQAVRLRNLTKLISPDRESQRP